MIKDNTALKNHSDDVLEELWQAKEYYSLSCNADFRELVKKIREDIKDISYQGPVTSDSQEAASL